jgi:hypothetical protein
MSAYGEKTLILHLTDEDSLQTLAEEGMPSEILPTEEFRPLYEFAIDYYIRSGRTQAPTIALLKAEFAEVLEDRQVDLDEAAEDTVEWAIDDLKGSWAYATTAKFNKRLAEEMAGAERTERIVVVGDAATALVEMASKLDRKSDKVDMREAVADAELEYQARIDGKGIMRGASLGLPDVDAHTNGIHEAELAIIAAYTKVGKTYAMINAARAEWKAGRCVALFSLELQVREIRDRIVCQEAGLDGDRWMRGECNEGEIARFMQAKEEMEARDVPLWVLQPTIGQRSLPMMLREAIVRDADTIMVDQLTHVELPGERKQKHERVGDALHELKAELSTSRRRLPCIINHQVNREGHQRSLKTGRVEPFDMADASEVERTADMIFALFRGHDEVALDRVRLQMLASRRTRLKWWELDWVPDRGLIRVRRELEPTT